MMLKAPFDLSEIQPKPQTKQYRIDGPKGIRVCRAANPKRAASQYLGHDYFWWVDYSEHTYADIYESDTDGRRIYVEEIA